MHIPSKVVLLTLLPPKTPISHMLVHLREFQNLLMLYSVVFCFVFSLFLVLFWIISIVLSLLIFSYALSILLLILDRVFLPLDILSFISGSSTSVFFNIFKFFYHDPTFLYFLKHEVYL